jgi:hypothetical protein
MKFEQNRPIKLSSKLNLLNYQQTEQSILLYNVQNPEGIKHVGFLHCRPNTV